MENSKCHSPTLYGEDNFAKNILIGCVAENTPKFLNQALRLVQSICRFGGHLSNADIIICVVDGIQDEYIEEIKRYGASIRIVPRFSEKHGPSNKLRFLELPEIDSYETIILLDCDTIVVDDPTKYIDKSRLSAKMADFTTVPQELFKKLFAHFSMDFPEQEYHVTYSEEPSILYCNAGVIIFPKQVLKSFYPLWKRYVQGLIENIHLLEDNQFYLEQAAFSLAYYSNPIPFKELPVSMNYPLHIENENAPESMKTCDPQIIHYHNCVNESGFISESLFEMVKNRITAFNGEVKDSRRRRFNNATFWDLRYDQYANLGSGMGSRGEVLEYKQGILKEMVETYKPKSILDVGCGDLFVTKDLPDTIYTGVDISSVIISKNKKHFPNRTFIHGDFQSLNLSQADMVICLDLVIHLDTFNKYKNFVKRFVGLAGKIGIISGYENEPMTYKSEITFFHEKLSQTLLNLKIKKLEPLGEYRETSIFLFQK